MIALRPLVLCLLFALALPHAGAQPSHSSTPAKAEPKKDAAKGTKESHDEVPLRESLADQAKTVLAAIGVLAMILQALRWLSRDEAAA